MSVPDSLAAVLVPFLGIFVDKYGYRTWFLIFGAACIAGVHLALGAFRPESPIPALVVLGTAYAVSSTFWSCIPILVSDEQLATAL